MSDASRNERNRPRAGSACSQVVLLEQAREELLRQVLGLVGRVAPPAHVGVEGIPVRSRRVAPGRQRRPAPTSRPRWPRASTGWWRSRPPRGGWACWSVMRPPARGPAPRAAPRSGRRPDCGRRAASPASAPSKKRRHAAAPPLADRRLVGPDRQGPPRAPSISAKGCRPVSISDAITASAHRSQPGVASSPRSCSGAM